MEEAAGYDRLSKQYAMTQEQIAKRVGKNRASVANLIRLLDLHPEVQVQVARKALSVGHAKVILALKDQPTQLLASEQVIRKGLTVRATERLVQHLANSRGPDTRPAIPPREIDVHIRAVANRLRTHLATHVAIHHSPKKGRIEIEYYGNDDLQRLLDLLGLPPKD
jgi:ParB family chromosome partitioning protein